MLRYSPEGEIPLAPFVNVTFNQPMVPLATLDDLAHGELPVQIEARPAGHLALAGDQDAQLPVRLRLIDRLPMATEYMVTVPAGTTSATGGVLAETVTFTFRTPPPRAAVLSILGEPQPLDPLFFVSFDQRVDPGAVLETITGRRRGRAGRRQAGHR